MPSPLPAGPALVHTAFYRFTRLVDPLSLAATLRDLLAQPPLQRLGGSIVLAPEGINGTVAGPLEPVEAFEHLLAQHPALGAPFNDMRFRRSGCDTLPFGRMKVHVR